MIRNQDARSTDYGESWTQVNEFIERPFYFSEIDVDPTNADVLWYSGLRLHYSTDGGASFQDRTGSQHGDFHGVWINPARGRRSVRKSKTRPSA